MNDSERKKSIRQCEYQVSGFLTLPSPPIDIAQNFTLGYFFVARYKSLKSASYSLAALLSILLYHLNGVSSAPPAMITRLTSLQSSSTVLTDFKSYKFDSSSSNWNSLTLYPSFLYM